MTGKKRKRNPLIWILLLLAIVTVLVFYFSKGPKDKSIKVTAETVEKRTIVETVYASGKLFPATEVEITSNVSGTIVDLLVEEGQSVKEGQLLAKIDPEALVSMVDRAEATSNSARAQLGNIKAQKDQMLVQLGNSKTIMDRNKQLLDQGVISQAEFELSETTYKSTLANIQAIEKSILSAEYNVISSEATVKEQKKNLSQTYIYAPMKGIVSKLYKKKGEQVVGTIQMAGTPILKIANLNSIEVRVDVNERDILNVNNNDTADIELDAYPGRKFRGIVTQIANTANNLSTLQLTSDQVTNFEVRVLLSQDSYKDLQSSDEHPPFRAGLSASVEIRTNTIVGVLTVPIAAVTAREDELEAKKRAHNKKVAAEEGDQKNETAKEEDFKEYVFIQSADSVRMQMVKTGIQDDKYIQIKEGLNVGDMIITAPYEAISKKLKAGSKINVVKEDELYTDDKKKWSK
jgi:HlyD family secretion protein